MISCRVIQQLGCSQGCGGGARGPPAECLRVQARCLLGRVRRAAPAPVARLLRTAAARSPLTRLLPFLHSYLAFCVDPSTLLSPLSQYNSTGTLFVSSSIITIEALLLLPLMGIYSLCFVLLTSLLFTLGVSACVLVNVYVYCYLFSVVIMSQSPF